MNLIRFLYMVTMMILRLIWLLINSLITCYNYIFYICSTKMLFLSELWLHLHTVPTLRWINDKKTAKIITFKWAMTESCWMWNKIMIHIFKIISYSEKYDLNHVFLFSLLFYILCITWWVMFKAESDQRLKSGLSLTSYKVQIEYVCQVVKLLSAVQPQLSQLPCVVRLSENEDNVQAIRWRYQISPTP